MGKKSNGEHSIYKVESKGLWCGQMVLGRDVNGKLIRKYVYGKTKKEVLEKLKDLEIKVRTGEYVESSKVSIYQLAMKLLDEDRALNYIKEQTYCRNIETLKLLKPIYATSLTDVTEQTIRTYFMENSHYAQSTLDKIYTLLHRILREAVKEKWIVTNPMDNLRKPKSSQSIQKIRAMTVEEQRNFLAVLQTEKVQYKEQMLLSLFTGMRMGEINALQVEDVNFTFKQIYIHRTISRNLQGNAFLGAEAKTDAGNRKIPMNQEVMSLLRDVIGDKKSGVIFTHKGQLINTSQVNMQLSRTLQKYNIVNSTLYGRVTLHSLRHTYATRCIEAGMSPKVLQTLLGHTDIKVTMNTYCDAFGSFQEDNLQKVQSYLESNGLVIETEKTG